MQTAKQLPIAQSRCAANVRSGLAKGKRVSFVSGNFNVVHPGHMRLLKFAAEIADVLVVGVNPDGAPGVSVPAELRLEGVQSISMVKKAVVLDVPIADFLAELKPDFVVKGREFDGQLNPEEPVVNAYGGRLIFSSGEMRFSSITQLQREFSEANFSAIRKPLDYPNRHSFSLEDVRRSISGLAGLRVLVVGDLIVDDYITCEPLGMSQEDPTIVVSPIETKTFVGGAGVVAAHAKGLGADVRYCAVVGDDETAGHAHSDLEARGIALDFIVDPTRPTTRKQRYRAHNKTLLRVNHLRQHAAGRDLTKKMMTAINRHLPKIDVLLFSDFNYGCLPQPLVDEISVRAERHGVLMAADSQASSQISDVSRFRGMALLTPTEREARLATQDFSSGLARLSEMLVEKAKARNVVITLGSEGMLVWGDKKGYRADRLPALNTSPKDPAGAGDSLFTTMALAMRSGVDVWQSAYIGALAAALQVSRIGNTPLTVAELYAEIDAIPAG